MSSFRSPNISRSKSRSPAPPPSPFSNASNKPAFHPPSYYAAAASVQYPLAKGFSDAGLRALDSLLHSPAASPRTEIRSPQAYEDQPSRSPRPWARAADDALSINSQQSFDTGTPSRADKRKSKVDLLETNLLPSLNDTIGRMTQSSIPRAAPHGHGSPHIPPSRQDSGTQSGRNMGPSLPSYDPTRYTDAQRLTTPTTSHDPRFSPQRPSPSIQAERSPSTPKSALRLPERPTPSRAPDGISSPVTSLKRTTTVALSPRTRSVRPPEQERSRIPSAKSKEGSQRPRSRSVAGAESSSRIRLGRSAVASPLTPQPSSSAFASPSVKTTAHQSQIRLQDNSGDYSSSAEYEAELDRNQRRNLFVTNAQIYPSSSESEEDSTRSNRYAASRLPRITDRTPTKVQKTPTGLGLRVPLGRTQGRSRGEEQYWTDEDTQESEGASIYDHDSLWSMDQEHPTEVNTQHHPTDDRHVEQEDRYHGRPPEPQARRYRDHHLEPHKNDRDCESEARRRRRETLVDLVDCLQLDPPSISPVNQGRHGGDAHTETKDAVGLAVSDSLESAKREVPPTVDYNAEQAQESYQSSFSPTSGEKDNSDYLQHSAREDFRRYTRLQEDNTRISARPASHSQASRPNHMRMASTPVMPPRTKSDNPPTPAVPLTLGDVQSDYTRACRTQSNASDAPPTSSRRSSISEYSVGSEEHFPSPQTNTAAQQENRDEATDRSLLQASESLVGEGGGYIEAQAQSTRSSVYSGYETGRLDDIQQALSMGAEALLKRVQARNEEHPAPSRGGRGTSHQRSKTASSYHDEFSDGRDRREEWNTRGPAIPLRRKEPSPPAAGVGVSTMVGTREMATSPAPADRADVRRPAFSDAQAVSNNRHEDIEARRQSHIRHVRETEHAFVKRLRFIIRTFIQPLRRQDVNEWIEGVPDELGRLFDWLDDIANVHFNLWDRLRGLQTRQGTAVERFAEHWVPFIPELEVYQAYIVKVQHAVETIRTLRRSSQSHFGEFVRMQEDSDGGDRWSLEDALIQPAERLMEYPQLFRQLLEFTPREHPDRLSTLSVLHATEMIIHVMLEVMRREREYEEIKDASRRILDLPPAVQLARRERRLLARGTARLLADGPKASSSFESYDSHAHSAFSSSYSDRWKAAENILATRRMEPRYDSAADSSKEAVHLLVFMDLLVIAVPAGDASDSEKWHLHHAVGISRILSAEQSQEDRRLIDLDVLLVQPDDFATGSLGDGSSIVQLRLDVSTEPSSKQWLDSLQSSARYTVRSLSFPSHSGKYLAHGPSVDVEADTKLSVVSLLAAGLPVPKSPSLQMDEILAGRGGEARDLEREERGWWAMRFQQVQREVQRQDGPIVLDLEGGFARTTTERAQERVQTARPTAAPPTAGTWKGKKVSGIPRKR
ncbi:hypothetical protein PUNSTDRAFT_130885 [Punctularia strigosozonata HHB-11173 SS5]|uniref:uncharacterized protein n=1 Tax=Punctularia strigosozonata (strain HHB-11173) TaxID=741275 RepID=UPI000441707A|nr:uncharacterized protein PUNSTDRAFT_130885 [Punctularia strigosozonata HHB-11173 SS5]EIN12628.1 hypothetical protein PUNSTDRAFT_130885 [Punctularia strigosozonata HHB-11173 SS5]